MKNKEDIYHKIAIIGGYITFTSSPKEIDFPIIKYEIKASVYTYDNKVPKEDYERLTNNGFKASYIDSTIFTKIVENNIW